MKLFDRAVQSATDNQDPPESMWQQSETRGAIFDIRALGSGDRWRHEAVIRGRCQTAYLGDRIALCRVLGRYKMYVDTGDIGVASHLMLDGYWEMWNTEMLVRLIKPGMRVLDIGAHCGYFTMLLADLVGPTGSVLAFEPNPPIGALLRRNVAVNGFGERTTVYEMALGEVDGLASLVVPKNEPKNAHIVPAGYDPGALSVPSERADAIPDTLDADFIKIDAEGAEEGIWNGLKGVFDRNRALTILLEFTPGRYADAGGFIDRILANGFSLGIVDLARGVLPRTRAEVLAAPPSVDQMLLLTRD